MEENLEKPFLSFGISSILGVSNYHKHLRTSSHHQCCDVTKSAFRFTGSKSKIIGLTAKDLGRQPGCYKQDSGDFSRDNDNIDKSHTDRFEASRFDIDTCKNDDIRQSGASTSTASAVDIANFMAAAVTTPLLFKSHEQRIPSVTTVPTAGAPFVPVISPTELTTQNYLLKSLETFRPKNFGR